MRPRNKVKAKAYAEKYRAVNKISINRYAGEYYLRNKERILLGKKEYRINNPDLVRKNSRRSHEKNKENNNKRSLIYYYNNKSRLIKKNTNYKINRRKVDIQFKLRHILGNRLLRALESSSKTGSAVRDLGCTIPELKFYLEGQFQDGMTWENHSRTGWHIDHKVPLDFFDLTDREQLLQAVHYTNLQPMWAKENIKKSNKITV